MNHGRGGRARSAARAATLFLLLLSRVTAGAAARQAASPPDPAVLRLQRDIDRALASPELEQGVWGILVKSLDRGETLYSLNPRKLLIPASNMKILTLAAAAERLGWDYSYETQAFTAGAIADGVLDGDLLIVGSGDPSIDDWDGFATRLFSGWTEQLTAAGVRTIGGRLIGDDNAFDDEGLGSGWAWDDLDRSFATGVGALQFNQNTAQLRIIPGAAAGEPASVTVAPAGSGLTLRNLLKTAGAGAPASVSTRRLAGGTRLDVQGSVSPGAPIVRNVSVVNPTLYFVTQLRDALAAGGIAVRGAVVDIDDVAEASRRADGRPLVIHRSPPLSTLAVTMMKNSQNLYAETLLRTLGGPVDVETAEAGRTAARSVLLAWGVPSSAFVMADGSGLSRYNLATPEALVATLDHVYRDDRLRELFAVTLPVAGVDGALAGRMKGTAAEGNARAKTGSLSNVRAISGYVRTADGELLVFSIMANNFGIASGIVDRAADAVVVMLAGFTRR